MIQAADIEQMNVEEKLQAMELLWASLVRTPDSVPSPEWHREVLEGRLAKVKRGEGEFLTIAELKERLEKSAP
jgi:Putative addiction module component